MVDVLLDANFDTILMIHDRLIFLILTATLGCSTRVSANVHACGLLQTLLEHPWDFPEGDGMCTTVPMADAEAEKHLIGQERSRLPVYPTKIKKGWSFWMFTLLYLCLFLC